MGSGNGKERVGMGMGREGFAYGCHGGRVEEA